MDPGADPGLSSGNGGHAGEMDERRRLLVRPLQRYTMANHTTGKPMEAGTAREDLRNHLRRGSGSPVSLALPARGTLFIVNNRTSEDL